MKRNKKGNLLDCEWIFYIGRSAYLHDEANAWTVGLCRQIECREEGKHMTAIFEYKLPKHWGYQKCKASLEAPIIETLNDTFDEFSVRFNKSDMRKRGCKKTTGRTNDWWTDEGSKIQMVVIREIENFRVAEGLFK